MHPRLRAFLEANGLRADASEEEAWKHHTKLKGKGIEYQGPERTESAGEGSGQRSAAAGAGGDHDGSGTAAAPVAGISQEDINRQIQTGIQGGIAADRQRCREIEDVCAVAGLEADSARDMIDRNLTVDQARAEAFETMRQSNPPIGGGATMRTQVGVESREKFRSAVGDGLALRSGIHVETPADGHREFRGRTLRDVARQCLEVAGVNVRGLNDMEIVGRAIAPGSTSDFPLLMSNLAGLALLQAYNEWPATFWAFVAKTSANDFKAINSLKMSEAPDLKGMNENGEYQTAKFSESGENYRVIRKGIKVALTREMIINDDLRAFTRIPMLFGSSARRLEGDAVYGLITANGLMSDGKALFHADHNNLNGVNLIDGDGLSAGRAAMRKQKGMSGADIDVTPAFLLTSVDDETNAEILLRSAALPDDNKSAGVHNPWAGKLTPIADPRLPDTDWYLFAHPNQFPVIEAAYLMGNEQPYVEEMIDFDSDALVTKVRHEFGAGVVDHVGASKTPKA